MENKKRSLIEKIFAVFALLDENQKEQVNIYLEKLLELARNPAHSLR